MKDNPDTVTLLGTQNTYRRQINTETLNCKVEH